jgi:hypothetical protein
MRNVLILSGFSILVVVLNHATWQVLENFSNAAPQGYLYIALDQVGKFAVSAFIFIAGYFVAYATNGGKRDLKWDVIRARITGLLWPWLIWSLFMTIAHGVEGEPVNLSSLFYNLLIQYYFIPLLMLCYLSALLLNRWIKTNLRALLIGAAVIQVIALVVFYLRAYAPFFSITWASIFDQAKIIPIQFEVFFIAGLIYGRYMVPVKDRLAKIRPILPWLVILSFVLQFGEAVFAYRLGGRYWPIGGDQVKLTSVVFSSLLILYFISFDRIEIPFQKEIMKLGANTYGIYLSHYVILGGFRRIFTHFITVPTPLAWLQILAITIMTILVCMTFIELTNRLRIPWAHKYVFP